LTSVDRGLITTSARLYCALDVE